MIGILTAITGLGLRGICGVHNYIDNKETIKRTTSVLPNGDITYMDNDYRLYINGERVYRDFYRDANGKEHRREIGVNTKKVYKDSFEERCKEQLAENEREKQKALAKGEKAYWAWHPRTPYTSCHITEISTGKIITHIMRDKWGNAKKMYAKEPERTGHTCDVVESSDVWIPISSEEFEALKITKDYLYVTDSYVDLDIRPGEDYIERTRRRASERIEEIRKAGGGIPHCDNTATLRKFNVKPEKYGRKSI